MKRTRKFELLELGPLLAGAALLTAFGAAPSAEAAKHRRIAVQGTVIGVQGEGLAGTTLLFANTRTRAVVARATTDAAGQYQVSLPAGSYDIDADPAGAQYVPQHMANQALAANQTLTIALQAQVATAFDMAFFDSDGEPLTHDAGSPCGFSANLAPVENPYSYLAMQQVDPTGVVSLAVPRGRYLASFSGNICGDQPSLERLWGSLTGPRRAPSTRPERVQIDSKVVGGTLLDGSGAPIEGTTIYASSESTTAQATIGGDDSASSDAQGHFSVSLLEGASQLIVIGPTETNATLQLPFAARPTSSIEVRIPLVSPYAISLSDDVGALPYSDCSQFDLEFSSSGGGRGISGSSITNSDNSTTNPPSSPGNGWLGWGRQDPDGTATLHLPAGEYETAVFYSNYCEAPNDRGPRSFLGHRTESFSVPSAGLHAWQLPTHATQGTIRDATGAPLAGVFVEAEMVGSTEGWAARLSDGAYSDAEGRFELSLLDGQGTFLIEGQSVAFDTRVPTTLDVVTKPLEAYVLNAPGGPTGTDCDWGTLTAQLTAAPPNSSWTYAFAESGQVTAELAAGTYDVSLTMDAGCNGESSWTAVSRSPHAVPTASAMTLALPGVQLDVAVVDAQGRPVVQQAVQLNAAGSTAEWDLNTTAVSTTDDAGRFSALVFAGSGELVLYGGLGETRIPLGELSAQSLLVTVPATGDATRLASLLPGQTLSTDGEGDGAKAWDPIETTLTSPNSGEARIVEGPVSEAAPAGYQLLAQQVTTTTRSSTTRKPWRIEFQVDATLFEDAGDVELFSNGSLVRGCRIRNGRITADPCIAENELGDDGALELTVLSSHPTQWTFGVPVRRSHGFDPRALF